MSLTGDGLWRPGKMVQVAGPGMLTLIAVIDERVGETVGLDRVARLEEGTGSFDRIVSEPKTISASAKRGTSRIRSSMLLEKVMALSAVNPSKSSCQLA